MFLGNVRTYEIMADLFIRSTITVIIKTISYCHLGRSTILNDQQKVILVAEYDTMFSLLLQILFNKKMSISLRVFLHYDVIRLMNVYTVYSVNLVQLYFHSFKPLNF